jgi:hypothetical protein
MQTVTPQKLILIAVVIGLGAYMASLVSTGQSSTSYALSSDTPRTKWAHRTPMKTSRHEFVERTAFPYSAVLHSNRNLEFDY